MAEMTARYGLELLQAGQAQKEITHNEALIRADVLLQSAVESRTLAVPPGAPVEGQCWIVAAAATGVWAGRSGDIACWSAGGWLFIPPREGCLVWVHDDGTYGRFGPFGWVFGDWPASALVIGGLKVIGARGAAVADPSGGSVIDAEARAAITGLLARLREHGLIAT